MELSLGRFWILGAGGVVGAIVGAWIGAQRATAGASGSAPPGSDDALIETARAAGVGAFGAALQGAFVGGLVGLALVLAVLYFTDPDRGMKIRKVDTGDDRY